MDIVSSNVDVVRNPTEGMWCGGLQLVGSFTTTEVPDYGYIVSKNKFWQTSDLKGNSATKAVKIKGQRAWLNPNSNSEARAHVLDIFADEEEDTTAIDAIDALTEGTAEIYDIQGRRTDRLQKGLNVVKTGNVTKKIMVK